MPVHDLNKFFVKNKIYHSNFMNMKITNSDQAVKSQTKENVQFKNNGGKQK